MEDLEVLDHSELSDDERALVEVIIEWGTNILKEDVFPQSDYKELLELTLRYLGGYLDDFRIHQAGFQRY